MNTVSLIQTHWYIIGLRLDLPEEVLKEFWTSASQLEASPKETYCCCKMLLYWHKKEKNLTFEKFRNAVNFPPFCFDEMFPLIKSLLLNEIANKSHFLSNKVIDTDRQYATMIAEVVELLDQCNVSLAKYKHYLDHCKSERLQKRNIDKFVYEHAANFSDLISALEDNGYITHADLSWLKYLVYDVANSTEALSVIEKYEETNVAQKLHWSSLSKVQALKGTFLVAKTDKSPALLSGKDVSKTKSAAAKLANIDETDAVLHSAGVGSVILYWKVSNSVRLEVPEFITLSLSQACRKAGITHIGTVVNQIFSLVEIIRIKHTSKYTLHTTY